MRGALWLIAALATVSSVHAAAINTTADGNLSVDDLFNRAAALLNGTTAPPATTATPTSAPPAANPNGDTNVAPPAAPLTPLSQTDPLAISDDLSVYAELYSKSPPVSVRNLRDNTQNTEAVVQSAQATNGPTDTTQMFPSPITVQPPSITTAAARRRLGGAAKDAAPVSVLFCDPAGNAIWKWDYYAPSNASTTAPPKLNTTTTTTTTTKVVKADGGVCDARTTIAVSAYQAGCSRQNHPEGCDNVYYKGCGGLAVNPDSKRVVVARTGGRSLGVLDYKDKQNTCQGQTVDAVTTFKGRKFNSPTDAAFTTKGDMFFTDSPFGLATKNADFEGDTLDDSPLREIPFNGVYVLHNNSKSVDLVDCTMDRPNKIAFSPKEDVMYVTNSRKQNSYVKAFPLAANGTIGTPTVFFNFSAHSELMTDKGYANGIKVDLEGNVFVAAYKGVFVLSPKAELLVAIRSNQEISGVSLGAGRLFYTGAFGLATQGGVNFSTVQQAITDC